LAPVAGLELTPPLIQFFGTQAMQLCIRLGRAASSVDEPQMFEPILLAVCHGAPCVTEGIENHIFSGSCEPWG